MNWALVDKSGRCLSATYDAYPAAMRSVLASVPKESHDELLRLLDEACAAGARRRLSIMQPERRLVVVDILPLHLPESGESPALVVLHDSAEFDDSYQQYKNVARRNEAILRSTTDGFFVVDAECHFLEVNEAFCRMTGYTAGELLHMRISDLEVDERKNGVAAHTQTGLHHFPTAHRHRDGHIVYLDISINVLHDAGVKILVGLARDVTERKRAEDEVARLTRQQRLILDSAADGIIGLNRAGEISLVNPSAARILGARASELLGRSAHERFFGDLSHAPQTDSPTCPVCAVLHKHSGPIRAEDSFARRDGARFPVEYSITAMGDRTDEVGAVLVFRDMTERRQAEQQRRLLEAQVQQAQKLESLGLLAGGIAHDLNNILAGIQGHACLALAEVSDETGVGQRLQRIVGACERASKIIRQILTYSGHVTCEAAPLDVSDLLTSVIDFMRAAVPRTIALETSVQRGLPSLQADGGQLQQALTNLLVNAVEAIGDRPGRVTLSAEPRSLSDADAVRSFAGQELHPGSYVAICVEDTGCGMPPETVDRIFEPFFSGKGTGRGLGLSAVRGVIRAHHGGIRVESEPGQGTRFTIVLPAAAQSGAPVSEQDAPTPLEVQPVVLVIDDEAEIRDVLKDMLTYHGLQVMLAADGTSGIATFRRHADSIDLVILDMAMPDKNGGEVFREIVAIRPDARVVVASGFNVDPSAAGFGKTVPAASLQKPFAMDTLIETVRNVLSQNGQPTPAVASPRPDARQPAP